MAEVTDWERLGVRVGTVIGCEPNDSARHPSYRLEIDIGGSQPAQSSARITERYRTSDLVGRQVVVVTGLEPIRVGGYRSDVLVLGVATEAGVILLGPGRPVPDGSKVT